MAAKPKVWVLTYEINEYDQDGEYFLAVFQNKPGYEEVVDFLAPHYTTVGSLTKAIFRLVDKGGGRLHDEHQWFHLKPVQLK